MDHELQLSDEQINSIAEKAAARALEKVYAEVGKSVLRKLAWFVGLLVVSGAMWIIGRDELLK